MKTTTLDTIIGFVTVLFFALVLPLIIHQGLGFLGYDTLSIWMPAVMGNFAGALFIEILLYIVLSAIVFVLYSSIPTYRKARKESWGASLSAFFFGTALGYLVFVVVVWLAISFWHAPIF
jgi:hypothetical protein